MNLTNINDHVAVAMIAGGLSVFCALVAMLMGFLGRMSDYKLCSVIGCLAGAGACLSMADDAHGAGSDPFEAFFVMMALVFVGVMTYALHEKR